MLVFSKNFAYALNEWSLAGSTKGKNKIFCTIRKAWFILEKICTRHLNSLKFSLIGFYKFSNTWDTLRNLVTYVPFKKREKYHEGVLHLVMLQAEAFNYTKSNTPAWVFFAILKLFKLLPNRAMHHICN